MTAKCPSASKNQMGFSKKYEVDKILEEIGSLFKANVTTEIVRLENFWPFLNR